MARKVQSIQGFPGLPIPYIGSWSGTVDANSRKVSNDDPDGPIEITGHVDDAQKCGGIALNIQLDSAGAAMAFELICVRTDTRFQGQVVYAFKFTVTTEADARRTDAENAAGYYIGIDATTKRMPVIDLRGTYQAGDGNINRWYLCPISITTATAAVLIETRNVDVT